MANTVWMKIKGLVNGYLKFGFKGPHLEKDGLVDNQLNILANNGVAEGIAKVATVKTKTIEISDSANSKKTTITLPTGAADDLLMQLPITDGNPGDVLSTDGSGQLAWSAAGGSSTLTTYDYDLGFGTGSPLNLVNMVANTRIARVIVDVTTAFTKTPDTINPTLSIGVDGGTADKYVLTADVDLTNVGTYVIDVEMIEAAGGQMQATYSADGATAGAAKIIVWSSVPQ